MAELFKVIKISSIDDIDVVAKQLNKVGTVTCLMLYESDNNAVLTSDLLRDLTKQKDDTDRYSVTITTYECTKKNDLVAQYGSDALYLDYIFANWGKSVEDGTLIQYDDVKEFLVSYEGDTVAYKEVQYLSVEDVIDGVPQL